MGLLDVFRSKQDKAFFSKALAGEREGAVKAARLTREKGLLKEAKDQADFDALSGFERVGVRLKRAGDRLDKASTFLGGVAKSSGKGAVKARAGLRRLDRGLVRAEKRLSRKGQDSGPLSGSLFDSINGRS